MPHLQTQARALRLQASVVLWLHVRARGARGTEALSNVHNARAGGGATEAPSRLSDPSCSNDIERSLKDFI
uniref:Putative secreted protein n=1 Tax=Ixodes ricinus TaxID=34613 RepID=A0A6B0U2G7_IXORI